MDTALFFFLNQDLKNPIFDFIMPFVTSRADILFVPFILFFFIRDPKKTLLVLSLSLLSVGLSDGSASILKYIFERPRPCQSLEGVNLLVGCGKSFSLPSNHAANAFALSAGLAYFFRSATMPFYFIATIVAFSRVYVGVHYPSDVVSGGLLGILSFFAVLAVYNWAKQAIMVDRFKTYFVLILLTLTVLRLFYINTGPLELSPDEAHYWEWSRRLDLSYYSKGPVIAYLIAVTTGLLGDSTFAVRLLAPLFLALCSIFVYKLTMELFNDSKKAFFAGLLPQITPLFAAFGVVMTIDSPFIFFWTLSLYLFWKAVTSNALCVMRNVSNKKTHHSSRSESSPDTDKLRGASTLITHHGFGFWLLLGLTVGLGLLTKYTMAFFYLCAFLFIIFSKENRFWLRRKEPYVAFALCLLIFSPVIIWNANYDWVTIRHTAGQAHIAEGVKISFKHFFEFLGSQIGVISPLLFLLTIYGAIKNLSSRFTVHSSRFLFWFWAPVLGFFLVKSLQGKVQANWAMAAYITAFIAAADFFLSRELKKGMKVFLSIALSLAFIMTMVAHYSEYFNLPVKKDPASRLMGWKSLGEKAGEVYNDMALKGPVFIFSDSYQVSSELAFYTPGHPRTYCVNLGRRMNQYDIWGGFNNLLGQNAIFVKIGTGDFPQELRNAFDSYEQERLIVMRKGRVIREYGIFRCYGFKGIKNTQYRKF
ncbi:MAG: glycosyltransferase family 39 protein [Nitrospirae bacterium]|nr:glycosyltransferase family 39 protein [Nitrospirota bacterium]